MKKINLLSFAFICTLTSLFITSCSSGAWYSIDNPTDKEISVIIDGKAPIKLAPEEFMRTEDYLSFGEHTIKVDGGEEVKFNVDKDHVMLNPTLSTYVKVLQEYGSGLASSDNDTTIVIDGKKYEGPFPLVTSDPIIYTGDLNFAVDKPFKDEIETSKAGTVIMKKLFRKEEFIDFYKKEY